MKNYWLNKKALVEKRLMSQQDLEDAWFLSYYFGINPARSSLLTRCEREYLIKTYKESTAYKEALQKEKALLFRFQPQDIIVQGYK